MPQLFREPARVTFGTMRVVLTGARGAGKSTVVKQIMGRLAWRQPAGFRTRRVEVPPSQWSLEIETWNAPDRVVFAHPNPVAPPGALPFALDTAACEQFARDHLLHIPPDRPVVLDELGIVEWKSAPFLSAVSALFDRSAPLLAVIQDRALDRWLGLIGAALVDHIQRVEPANRDLLADAIARDYFSSGA